MNWGDPTIFGLWCSCKLVVSAIVALICHYYYSVALQLASVEDHYSLFDDLECWAASWEAVEMWHGSNS